MPALVSSSPYSGGATSDDERTRVWPRSSKKRRKVSRMSAPSTPGSLAVGFAGSVAIAELVLPLVSRPAAFLHRGGDELAQIEETTSRLTGQCRRRRTLGLPAGPPRPGDRPRGAEPDAGRHPKTPREPPRRAPPRTAGGSHPRVSAALAGRLREPLADPGAEADELHQRAARGLLHQAGDPFDAIDDLRRAVEHDVDSVDLAVGLLDRGLDLAQQRDRLLPHRVDRHLGALEHTERVQQYEAQEQDQKHPANGQHDQGDVAAREGKNRHPWAPWVRGGGASLLDSLARLIRAWTGAGGPIAHVGTHVGGLVIPVILVALGAVVLVDPVPRLVVGIHVALAVTERARASVGRVAQVRRDRLGPERVFLCGRQGGVDAVGLRRARKVDRRLREVEPRLGQPDML